MKKLFKKVLEISGKIRINFRKFPNSQPYLLVLVIGESYCTVEYIQHAGTLYSKIEKNQPQLLRFRIQNYSAISYFKGIYILSSVSHLALCSLLSLSVPN